MHLQLREEAAPLLLAAEPQRHVHHLVIEGARADGDAPASLAFEAAVEVIDRSYRPKQKDKAPPEREDPIREPRPRELAALR